MKTLKNIFRSMLLLLTVVLLVNACDESVKMDVEDTTPPTILNFSPKTGAMGTEIHITGDHLLSVDTILIGDKPATITQKVSAGEVYARVNAKNRTGVITVRGSYGQSASTESFTVTFIKPQLVYYPPSAKVNQTVIMEGENMNAILKVMFNEAEAVILMQDAYSVTLQVPFFEGEKADIHLYYQTEAGEATISTSGKPFVLEPADPVVIESPSSGNANSNITITGTDLDQVDEVYFGEYKGAITEKESSYLVVEVPDIESGGNYVLKIIYHGNKELVINQNFKITIPGVYYREGITLYAQASENANFYSITGNRYFTPCEWNDNTEVIELFMTAASGGLQICNPSWSSGYNKFKCDGVALSKPGQHIRFRKMYEDNPAESVYIEKVKNKTLDYISVDELIDNGVNMAYSSFKQVARVKDDSDPYNKENPEGMYIGGVNVFVLLNSVNQPVKVGFFELISVDRQETVDTKGSVTINCYYQR